jgi:hypothetical protein
LKRNNQLIAESAIVGSLIILTAFGGISAGFNVPRQWTILQNPNSVTIQHSSSALALYYNTTLSLLGEQKFDNVSFLVKTFHFVNIEPGVNQTALVANGQISYMNVSVPRAISNFGLAGQLIAAKELLNASIYNARGCGQARDALGNYTQFAGSTTTQFSKLGVPVQQYSVGMRLTHDEIESLIAECQSQAGVLPGSGGTGTSGSSGTSAGRGTANLTIWSPQRTIITGSYVTLGGNLTARGIGLSGRPVLFYLNGTYIGSVTTDGTGHIFGTLSIPFVYEPVGVISAYAVKNATVNFPGAISNNLYFAILFSATKIIIGDPSAYLPTFSFSVHGSLTTVSGVPLPFAPVKVTFLNESSYVSTDSKGTFGSTFTVPADESNGIYYVYAAFSPHGVYGPSFNFTSIEVTHLPLIVTAEVPRLSFAGFSTSMSGTVVANGSALSNVKVSVSSPWGVYQTRSGSAGDFSISIPIPIWEFAFSRNVSVTASAVQPYIAQGQASARVGLFNLLFVALPALGVGVGAYEFMNLGLLPKLRTRFTRAKRQQATMSEFEESANLPTTPLPEGTGPTGMIAIYAQAIALASRRFGIRFRDSETIREIIREVEKLDRSGMELFSEIMLATEDFLYSKEFDLERIKGVETDLARLRGVWGTNNS